MADFIDSMFGVYSSSSSTAAAVSTVRSCVCNCCGCVMVRLLSARVLLQKSPATQSRLVDLTAEPDEADLSSLAAINPDQVTKKMTKKAQRGALRTAIEAGEKVREIQRSKEQWIKSRHQVLEEEGASAIKSDKSSGMLEVPAEKSGENATQQGCGGVALANQIRAHQHIAAFVKASTKGTTAIPPPPPPPPAPMSLLLTSQLAIPSTAAPLIMPAPLPPPPPPILTTAAQPIKPNTTGSSVAKIALPPANSALNLNMFFPFPGATPLVFNPQVAGGLMPMAPWPQMPASVPARAARPARPQGM